MSVCAVLAPPANFLGSVLYFVDCQARTIGAAGYQSLSAPGSSASLVLTGLLAIFVALFGYRMLLGQTPSVRDGVLALAKIGLVLALATGWPAYKTLIYDVVFDGPVELARDVAQPAGVLDGRLLQDRLQLADQSMVQLALAGTGEGLLSPAARRAYGVPPPPVAGFDSLALGTARTFYLTGAVAAFASVRLIAGLLLALGPLFIGFLLFEGTRGLFEGWLRTLIGAALGAFGTTMVLAVELTLLEPRLADWLARRAAGLPLPGAAAELLAISLIFAGALVAVLVASARVARGLRLPSVQQLAPAMQARLGQLGEAGRAGQAGASGASAEESRRAVEVAGAVMAAQRREALRSGSAAGGVGAPSRIVVEGASGTFDQPNRAAPIGRSFRRTRTRVSVSAGKRDRRA